MAATWSDGETFKLVELWGDEEIQALLEGCARNKHVYDKIAARMVEAGYERTGVQCRDKIKKLKGEYKKIKDNNNETGRKRKVWKFYDCMNDILGSKPATQPAVVIDTLELDEAREDDDLESSGGSKTVEVVESTKEGDAEKSEERSEETTITITGEDKDQGGKVDIKNKKMKERPKKRGREDKFEKALGTIVDKMMQSQKESDEMFMSLEEKRMRFDERLMEMEDRRLREDKEREERLRREERDFQLRMMMMQQGMQQGVLASQHPSFSPPGVNYNDYSLQNSSSSSAGSQWPEQDM